MNIKLPGRTHGAGCVRQWFRTPGPLGKRRYENSNTHLHTHTVKLHWIYQRLFLKRTFSYHRTLRPGKILIGIDIPPSLIMSSGKKLRLSKFIIFISVFWISNLKLEISWNYPNWPVLDYSYFIISPAAYFQN